MRNWAVKMFVFISIIVMSVFVLFAINQTAQFVSLLDRISPALGTVALWMLLVLYAVCITVPVVLFMRLPKTFHPPESEDSPDFPVYMERLKKRLQNNPHLKDHDLENREHLQRALDHLGTKADEVTKETSMQVFFMTALSQNGSLDAIAVITTHFRMVLKIARIYNQRPSVRDLLFLYSNVAVSALTARQLEDMDLSELINPVVSSTTSLVIGSTPFIQGVGNIVTHSVLTGSTNAYLTLRVGVITKLYCGSLALPEHRSTARKIASIQAAKMIPAIVQEGTQKVTAAFVKATAGSVKNLAKSTADTVATGTRESLKTAKNLTSATLEVTKDLTSTTINTARDIGGKVFKGATDEPKKKKRFRLND